MDADEKLDSVPVLKEAGNKLFKVCEKIHCLICLEIFKND